MLSHMSNEARIYCYISTLHTITLSVTVFIILNILIWRDFSHEKDQNRLYDWPKN